MDAYGKPGEWVQLARVVRKELREGLLLAGIHGLVELGYKRKRRLGIYKKGANSDPKRIYLLIGGLPLAHLHKIAKAGRAAADLTTVDQWNEMQRLSDESHESLTIRLP